LGSIPWGVLIGRAVHGVDVRRFGSGNIGATNVLRVLGPVPAACVLVLDVLKGAGAAYLGARTVGAWGGAVAGLFSVVGHSFSVWLKFGGGKSVACGAGALFVLAPRVGLIGLALMALTVALTRYVSLGSIVAASVTPFVMLGLGESVPNIVFGAAAGGLIVLRHSSNIRRLLAGKEHRLGEKVSR